LLLIQKSDQGDLGMTSEFDPLQEDAFFPANDPGPTGEVASSEPAAPDNSASQSAEDAAAPEFSAAPTGATSDADAAADSFPELPLTVDAPADFSSADEPTDVEAANDVAGPTATAASPGFQVSPLAASYSGLPPFNPPRWVNGRRMISFEGAASESASSDAGVASPQAASAPAPAPSPAAAPATGGATNPRLQPTADGGPPLARPIVLASLHNDAVNAVVEAAVQAATERDTKTLAEIAEGKIDFAFFRYLAERRVLHR
jgi:hypothetical protein